MAETDILTLVIWLLDEQRYALPLTQVQGVLLAIEVTPLPDAPKLVMGIVNVQGRIMPVVDLRKRFSLPARDTMLGDHLMLVQTTRRCMGFFVDSVQGVVQHPVEALVRPDDIVPRTGGLSGVLKLPDGLVLIHDLDSLLSLDDESAVDQALAAREAGDVER